MTDSTKQHSLLKSSLLALSLAFVSTGFLTACEDQGPAEEAGERIDDAAEDAADATEDAADNVEREFD